MSYLYDARVLAAFNQGAQRPYMLGVEQRLTDVRNKINTVTGSADGMARLNCVIARRTSNFSTSSSTGADITGLSGLITTSGGLLVVFASAEEFFADVSSGGASAEVGVSVDGVTEWVWQHAVSAAYTDTYGLCVIRAFTAQAGQHNVKLVAKTNSGTAKITASSSYPAFFMVCEI